MDENIKYPGWAAPPRVEEKSKMYTKIWDGLKGREKMWSIQTGPDCIFSNKL